MFGDPELPFGESLSNSFRIYARLSRFLERISARKRYWLDPLGVIRLAHGDLLSHNH
jgi:hypothetical protein